MGTAAAFSFYPGKNLGACGEGGAVTTNDADVAKKIRMLRDHGQAQKYYHDIEGYNGRLDSIQAGLLRVKLGYLNDWNELRQQAAARYRGFLGNVEGVVLPYEPSFSKPVYHLFVIRVEDREALQKHLAEAGISTGIHYPIPLHLQKAYVGLGYSRGTFPVTERVAGQILSLPMYPQLRLEQQQRVAEQMREFASIATPTLCAPTV
jgi:dTDP-4-amino-4,6-dideoxygalactose transaminase